MIASISGKVLACSLGAVTLEVGGVGLLVNTTSRTCDNLELGQPATLKTVLVVREDSLTLYGFLDSTELETFDLLRSVNGVGPKSALSILSSLTVQEISAAVASESDDVFRAVTGVGPKTAKLITVSLAGKLNSVYSSSSGSTRSRSTIEGLVGLGYSEKESSQAVAKITDPDLSDQQVLKLALQQLAKGSAK